MKITSQVFNLFLSVMDCTPQINGVELENRTHKAAVELFRTAGEDVKLRVLKKVGRMQLFLVLECFLKCALQSISVQKRDNVVCQGAHMSCPDDFTS